MLHHHAGRAPVECLEHEAMPVVTRPRPADRDEHLARVEPAMIVAAAGDFPVRAADEPGLREQPPQAHRRDPPLGQTVNEPARHRLTPPCLRVCQWSVVSGREDQVPCRTIVLPGMTTDDLTTDHRSQPRSLALDASPGRRRHCWPKPGKRQCQSVKVRETGMHPRKGRRMVSPTSESTPKPVPTI